VFLCFLLHITNVRRQLLKRVLVVAVLVLKLCINYPSATLYLKYILNLSQHQALTVMEVREAHTLLSP
jgi:hypothetical protein